MSLKYNKARKDGQDQKVLRLVLLRLCRISVDNIKEIIKHLR